MTLCRRRELCAAHVTMGGNCAKISGARRDFALVTDLKTGKVVEYAWDTVERIVKRGGKFPD